MWKNVIFWAAFVLFLCIFPSRGAADPNLVCWWKFDGNANDSSIYALHHGTENGGPGYTTDGYDGQAIVLDGNDDFVVYSFAQESWPAFTVALWVKTNNLGQDTYSGVFNNNSSGSDFQFDVDGSGSYRYHGGVSKLFGPATTDWIHLAAACDGANTSLYYNSNFVMTEAAADTEFGQFAVGINRNTTNCFEGTVDDVRVYDKVLTQDDIRELVPSGEPFLVSPENGATLGMPSVQLEWELGLFAADVNGHDVYLGENPEDVYAGTGGTFLDSTDGNVGVYGPIGLGFGKVYYWRVIAVNDLHPDEQWESEVWSFTVPDTTAWVPFPAFESGCVDPNVELEWKMGLGGIWNDVYFGDNPVDVNTDTNDVVGTFQARQKETTYPVGPLEKDTEYFWRVDTVDGGLNVIAEGAVWSFTTKVDKPITADPNLVGYWKLDEICPGIVVDDSGYEHDGRLRDGASFVPGYDNEAVEFDGDNDYVTIDGYKGILGTHAFSVAAWIKTVDPSINDNEQNNIVCWGNSPGGSRVEFRVQSDKIRISHGSGYVQSLTTVNDGEWHHIAATAIDGATISSSDVRIYVDGRDDTDTSSDEDAFDIVGNADVGIGYRATHGDRFFEGLIDEVMLYDRVLSESEVRNLGLGFKASDPSPVNGAQYEGTSVTLSWTAGRYAALHNVYFGTDSGNPPLVDANRPLDSNSYGLVDVELGETYYWYINEVNDPCVWQGDAWSFEVKEYHVVDDFDSYAGTSPPNEPNLLGTWKDGSTNETGSTISLQSEFAGNSMKYVYDNNDSPFSDAELVYDTAADWTAGGARALALEFKGDVNNSAEWMYVAIQDTDGNNAVVEYEDMNDLGQDNWHVWNIALQDFNDEGVDLAKVKKFIVGFLGGDSGTVYIDNIRLYPPRCIAEYAVASFDDDCFTGFSDLDIILRYWLAGGYNVSAVKPNDDRLQAHYKFDETSGTDANDSSGKNYHATVDPNGVSAWDPCGYDGYCLDFDGTFAVSVPNDVFSGILNEVTVSVWVHVDANVNPNTIGRAEFGAGPADANEAWDRVDWIQENPEDNLGRWSHYAFVKDSDNGRMRIYHNGLLAAQETDAFAVLDGTEAGRSVIGAQADDEGSYYVGKLDDFRIYDYALAHNEILYLAAGVGSELYQPLQPALSPVDPYEDGKINFMDIATLGEWWLRESLWP